MENTQRALFDEDEWPIGASTPVPAHRDTTGDWLTKRLATEDAEEEENERLFASLAPRPRRLIVSRPYVAAAHKQRVLDSGLFAPDSRSVIQREWGLRCTILKIHPSDVERLATEDVFVGSDIVIPEHSGHPIYLGRETPWWIISELEIMAVVVDGAPHAS